METVDIKIRDLTPSDYPCSPSFPRRQVGPGARSASM
jgi:hypothetical protein